MILGLAAAWVNLRAVAESNPAATNAPAAAKLSPAELQHNMSYSIGMNIGTSMKRGGVDLDVDVLTSAIKDVLAGREPKLTEQQAQEAMREYQKEARAKHEETQKKAAEKNKKEGEAFLAENKKKEGIKIQPIKLADGTTAELQYKILTEGSGSSPKSNDTVTVHYRGTLINGKEFDSSAKRGQPAKFQVNRVIRGWTEALEMMKPGAKWQLFIPSSLAYGDGGNPSIEPGSTLLFDVELLSADAPAPPPPPAQPLTSDIIRVPSADELKKGAKIEVIKPEDLEKYTNSAAKKLEK
jgi:FKBP-type peptidyl-prolyl cis-trans isomerase FklB